MSFATQALKYGWVALASLGALTGTTIYVLNNQRHQVKPQDIIEIALGVTERALATQYSTNPVSYYVAPPSFVRTWYSNAYTTNGVTIYTNIVTNTIGWHVDRAMMVSLDATIKALIPYYVDTNTVYDGTTNISMLTVTGLWASLGIGGKTNQFTREPCWTNPVSTNWIINYTSYWPSTNGTATTICYTSDYRQVVNYAQSWTATGGHVWVASSNWASEVVIVTNAATYGSYSWPMYAEDLQERYKVLEALKYTQGTIEYTNVLASQHGYGRTTDMAWADRTNNPANYFVGQHFQWYRGDADCDFHQVKLSYNPACTNTELTIEQSGIYLYIRNYQGIDDPIWWNDFGAGYYQDQYNLIAAPYIVPPVTWTEHWGDGVVVRGWGYKVRDGFMLLKPNFSYCTNKYW